MKVFLFPKHFDDRSELVDNGFGELPLALRRSMVSSLASIRGDEARNALVDLVDEPALGPAALTSLGR